MPGPVSVGGVEKPYIGEDVGGGARSGRDETWQRVASELPTLGSEVDGEACRRPAEAGGSGHREARVRAACVEEDSGGPVAERPIVGGAHCRRGQ